MNTLSHDHIYARSIVLAVTSFGAIAYLCASLSIFAPLPIILLWGITIAFFVYKKWLVFPRPSNFLLAVTAISLLVAIFVIFVTEPTMYTGRDQGALASAAVILAETGSPFYASDVSRAFFDIYGRGPALNFPGFVYTADGSLTTQFPLPYIAFLGFFFALTDAPQAFAYANAILLVTFLISLVVAGRFFLSQNGTWWLLALILTSFATLWFAKFTLSENLAAALLWSGAASLLMLRVQRDAPTLLAAFLSFGLLLFARIEGIWFFIAFLGFLLYNRSIRNWLAGDLWMRLVMPLSALCAVGIAALTINTAFYKTILGVFLKEVTPTVSSSPEASLLSILAVYNILLPALLSLICLGWMLYKKRYFWLFPFLLVGPVFFYLIDPHISADHPWMIRRYAFAILPAVLLGTALLTRGMKKPVLASFAYTALFAVIIINLIVTVPTILHADHRPLVTSVATLADRFDADDLVLLHPEVTANGWAMLDGPLRLLHGKNAVYFFNPDDYTRLDLSPFENVYLIAPQDADPAFGDLASEPPIDTLTISDRVLPSERTTVRGPLPINTESHNFIYKLR